MKKLHNTCQMNATRGKLKMLEEQYEKTKNRPGGDEHLRELTLGSLGRRIKQLKEEIMWYESHLLVREAGNPGATPIPYPGETSTPCTN